jgi:hypothetical protein
MALWAGERESTKRLGALCIEMSSFNHFNGGDNTQWNGWLELELFE